MIAITGATGKLGRHTLHGLLKVLPANQIIAAVRNPAKATDLTDLGIQVREADYNRPETLRAAFNGVDKLLLISSNDLAQRMAQHTAVIAAALQAGVQLVAYTSLLRASTSTLALAPHHKATEAALQGSGLPFVFLRNGWYLENHTENLAPALAHGAILGSAGDGLFASASRADFAQAAVAVLTTEGHQNKIYELAGDTPYTLTQLAAAVAARAGKAVAYNNLPAPAFQHALESFGLPPEFVGILVDSDLGAGRGELTSTSNDLRTLIGRPTTTLADAIAAAL